MRMTETTRTRHRAARAWATGMALVVGTAAQAQPTAVTDGTRTDYQPSVIRTTQGDLLLVFERLDAGNGDLLVTRSVDDGATWSVPLPVVSTSATERHPALLQLAPDAFALFYLKGSGSSNYRIHRATSSDGATFAEQPALDLGWSTPGEINPHVIRHADGTLTMSYQRIQGGSYVAQSTDDGVTWDTLQTSIAASSQLPRIAYRESDGVYLASYQVGSSALQLFVETTTDVRDWSAPARAFTTGGNHHDSLPFVMPDGAFGLFWIAANGSQFDLRSRRSLDGVAWQRELVVTATPAENDVEPHPLVGTSPTHVQLYWGRESSLGSQRYAIVRDAAVPVRDDVFADGFD